MRRSLIAALAWQDWRDEWRLSLCAVLALVAVVAPLLLLFGLKFGLINGLTERLQQDPGVREIIPLAGGRFSAGDIEALAARPDVGFALPRTRQIAATADLLDPDGRALAVEMIPTAAGDPLLGHVAAPTGVQDVLLSQTAAQKLHAQAGQPLVALISRQDAGQVQTQRVTLQVSGILPITAFQRDAIFAPLVLLEAAEDYRDGRAVPALGWAGSASGSERVYPAFRLYARDLAGVEPLRQYFAGLGLSVATQAGAIEQVQALSRRLSTVFWLIAGLACGGAFAAIAAGTLAAVERKRRALAVLRLLGLRTTALLAFVLLQALYSAFLAALLAVMVYAAGAAVLNTLFDQLASHLLPAHLAIALLAILAVSLLAAMAGGWRVTRLQPAQGIRDV
ncbi:FtsX-like permease family protein [Pseudomonas sp.]|uniref:FtsX-like permease family protein n=1 Tax=Pseudomonas sp. TaxID=306 RepID=UPI00258AD8AD|nr:FtsX-like permease family protein [Pseudomonas sp.]